MGWFQTVFLAVLQGLTEFLPISSSGHLLIPSQISDWPDQGLMFDVAVHLGTLFAVVLYFYKDVWRIALDWCRVGLTQQQTDSSRQGWMIIIATLPVLLVGYIAKDFIEGNLRSATVIAIATLLFGLLLGAADLYSSKRSAAHVKANGNTFGIAFIIGLFQVLALIPGTSRSGITMTAALFMGLDKQTAARFSFLLSIPVIFLASLLYGYELMGTDVLIDWPKFIVGILLSGLTAWVCIHYFLSWIEKMGFMPFVLYRIVLAAVLFLYFV